MLKRNRPCLGVCLAVASLAWPSGEAAEGVRALPDSAEALGMVGGRFTLSEDPSVVRSNPASLVKFDEAAFQLNFQAWHGDTDFTRLDGRSDSMIHPWKLLGGLNVVYPISDTLTAGVGVSAPFGLSIDWRRDGIFRYLAPSEALLQTIAVNPAVGIRLTERLSLGLGADIFYSRLKLEQAFPWSLVTGTAARDGDMVFDGDGWGLGGYMGLNFEINDDHRIALTGRLPVEVDYEGDFTVTHVPGALSDTFATRTQFESQIEFPGSVGVGYGWDLTERLSLGIDFEWIQNSSHDDLPLSIGRNQAMLGTDGLDLGWKDSFSTGFGLQYQVNENLKLRSGYLYSESPLRDETYTPAVPGNDRHMLSVGAGYEWGKNTIDLSYTYLPFESRSVRGAAQPGFDGDYEYRWHVVGISYTRKF